MSSIVRNGCLLAFKWFDGFVFCQYQTYLYNCLLLAIRSVVNGCEAVNTIAPLSLITLSYCSHKGSKGITLSHLFCVVPYGKSAKIISTEPSRMSFINSKQSPCNNLIVINFTHFKIILWKWCVFFFDSFQFSRTVRHCTQHI